MSQIHILLPAGFSLLILLVYMSIFYVEEHKKAILFRLGEMVASDFKPGPSVNAPIINNVSTFDARVLTLDAKSKHYLTSEKKDAIVDSFAAWQTGDEGFFIRWSAVIPAPPIFMRKVSVKTPSFTLFTAACRLIWQRLKKTRIPWR